MRPSRCSWSSLFFGAVATISGCANDEAPRTDTLPAQSASEAAPSGSESGGGAPSVGPSLVGTPTDPSVPSTATPTPVSPTPTAPANGTGGTLNVPTEPVSSAGAGGAAPVGGATNAGGANAGTGGTLAAGSGGVLSTAGNGAGGSAVLPLGGAGGGTPELAAPNASAKNPIVTHVFTADPSADVYDGRIYVFTSHDPDDQAGYDMVDYHAFSSDDLVNWQDHGVVLDSADITWTDRLYAPDTCYSEAMGKYYLYFPNSGSAIGVAVSDVPGGPYVDAIGRPLIDANTPGVGDVDWLFDPTCFIDDDGQAYLYFGGGPSGTGDNARVVRLGDDMTSLADGSATTIVAPDFFEASFMHKRDGKYYYSYSTGFENHAAYIDYMMSDQPMSGFEYVGTVLPSPVENNGDNNHHSMLEYEGQWYIFYHNRVLSNQVGRSNYQRSITLDKMSYDAGGLINEVPTQMGEVPQLRSVDAFSRIEAEFIAAESGIETDFANDADPAAGVMVTELQDGDWIGVSQIDFRDGAASFVASVASEAGGSIVVYQGGCEGFRGPGTEIGSCDVPAGGSQDWTDVECAVQAAAGVHDLCLLFTGGAGELLNLDHYHFE